MITVTDLIRNTVSGARTLVLARHQSAEFDAGNRDELHAYVYGTSDPKLSEKGQTGAQQTARSLPAVDAWYSSRKSRAWQTAMIFARGEVNVIYFPTLDAPDYREVSPDVVDSYMATEDDATLHAVWVRTAGFKKASALAAIAILNLLVGPEQKIGIVSHDEICRLMLCHLLGYEPERFAEDEVKISRGEYVVVTITPDIIEVVRR